MSLSPVPQVVIKNADKALLSVELWASSKITGRECAETLLAFYKCKEAKGPEPKMCQVETEASHKCAQDIVAELNQKFGPEFVAFQKCLDYNDHRFNHCRKLERVLLDLWNKEKKYIAVEDK